MAFIIFCKEAFEEHNNQISEEIKNRGWGETTTELDGDNVIMSFDAPEYKRIRATILRENNQSNVVFRDYSTQEIIE